MPKATCLAVLVWLPFGVMLAQSLEDMPVPAGVSLVRENGTLNFLSDDGRSLYVSDRDPVGRSVCEGQCATLWPPVSAPVDAHRIGDWTPIRRADRSFQWAYKGKPVYTYRYDTMPGQSNGAGSGGVWHILIP